MTAQTRASRRSPDAAGGWLARAAAFFVAPAAEGAPARAATIPPAARAVVLGPAGEVVAAAAAVALGLRERDAAPAGLVAIWRGDPPAAGMATRAAARLSGRVGTDGLPARARGRLAWLSLPGEPSAAAGAVRRASALVAGPFVTALAGARPAELETLIAEHDIAVVVADPETALARAALAALTARGVPAVAVPPVHRGLARTLALAGVAAPRLTALGTPEPARDAR
jgi:hypothetical protein